MQRTVIWLARAAGFVVVGLLALIGPPHGSLAVRVQIAGYCLLGAALVAWSLIDTLPAATQRRERALPLVLGLTAVAVGFAAAVGGGGDSMVAFAIAAALAAGSDCALPAALAVTATGILAIEAGAVVFGQGFGTLLGFPLLLLMGLLAGRNRGAYRIQAEQSAVLLAQYEQLQAEQRRADVLDERTRIAREIHDVLAHSLGALGIQIQAARAVLTDHNDTDRALSMLATAQRMAGDGLVETRRAVHALRVDTLPLDQELARTVETHRRRYGVPVDFDTAGPIRALPPDATVALLRTTQEALINTAKHAPEQPVSVRLDYREHEVRLTVGNDLPASQAAAPPTPGSVGSVGGGYGLTGMHERVRLLDGTLSAGPGERRWTVTAQLPLAPGPRPEDAV